jgi:hypothetical protein
VDITEDIPVLSKGIWVAWSGDSNWSLTKYMPAMFYERTVFLDALLDKFPAFHDGDGPGHYGTYLKEKAVEPLLKKRWKPTIEDMACKVVGSKEELLEELQALRRGEIR